MAGKSYRDLPAKYDLLFNFSDKFTLDPGDITRGHSRVLVFEKFEVRDQQQVLLNHKPGMNEH